jgi:phosphatidate cytidylyltransferase
MLLKRILSALLLIPLIVGPIYLGGYPLLVLALVVAVLGYYEFDAMLRRGGRRPFRALGLVLTLLLVSTPHIPQFDTAAAITVAVLLTLLYSLFQARSPHETVLDAALTLVGAAYVGWLLRYALLTRMLPGGFELTIIALVGTWAADTGAFLAGSAFGKRKVYPRVSPGKTWEGVAGGLALTVVVLLLAGTTLLQLEVWQSLFLGVVITAAAALGDLVESAFKRAAGVKDSGALIPGHGGLLDRADSVLFVLPVFYYSYQMIVR